MAPSAATTGVPSMYGEDGDSRGVWGSTRELHLKVGAHLRESRAARSDERYKNFVAYAKRRQEEREGAPDRGRGGETATGGAKVASSSDGANGGGPSGPEEPPSGDPGSSGIGRLPNSAPNASSPSLARRAALGPPVRVGGGYRRDEAEALDEDAPVDPRERRVPKPEPPRRWEEVAAETREALSSRARLASGADDASPAETDEDPTLLMLKALERAARDLGVKRTGVWTALGKPYAVEGPPTVTPPANPRAAFPRRAPHPDDVAAAVARRRDEARAGGAPNERGKGGGFEFGEDASARESKTDETETAASFASLLGARPETPPRDALASALGFGEGSRTLGGFPPSKDAEGGERDALSPRAAYRERKSRGRFDRGALEASAARVRRAKHGKAR